MKLRLVAVSALTGAVMLTGCTGSSGSSGSGGATGAPTTSAASAPAVGRTLAGNDVVDQVLQAMSTAKTAKQKTTITSANASSTIDAEFSIDGDRMDVKATSSSGQSVVETIAKDGILYVKGPRKASNGAPWIKIDPNGNDPLSKQLGAQFRDSSDPRKALELYKGTTFTVSDVKDGITTYRVTGLSGSATNAGDVTFSVDEKNRPQKVTTKGALSSETIYSDWGSPVSIQAPPADEVGTAAVG